MNIEENIRRYYPKGFLGQLGKELGCIVGLGDYKEEKGTINLDVRTKDQVLGKLKISFYREEFQFMEYSGVHPISTKENKQLRLYFGKLTHWLQANIPGNTRGDNWKNVVFPGIVD